jgi:uncharacterized protein with ATP-grasp and redox domains
MISDYRCFFCFVRAFERLLEKEEISVDEKGSFIIDMISLYQNSYNNFSAPLFSRELHHILCRYTNNPDPYFEEKKENNQEALLMVPDLEKLIFKSKDTFDTALRIAIAGNIIDFAANDNFNMHSTIQRALTSKFAIDHSVQLKEALKNADNVLYLGDNAGEIIFDKLFIRTLNHSKVTYVVRSGPILNDATMEDADFAGMKEFANVISSGYDAPSTIPGKSGTEFKQFFNEADVIISKGQGNLEGLIGLNDKRTFFLLLVKCDVIAEFIGVEKNSFVVFNSLYGKNHHKRENLKKE